MSGLEGRTDGLPQADINQHHLAGAGDFSTGEMGNFQPALTRKLTEFLQIAPGRRESR